MRPIDRKPWPVKLPTLAQVDAWIESGRCMWRAFTAAPCGKQATIRRGIWQACSEEHVSR